MDIVVDREVPGEIVVPNGQGLGVAGACQRVQGQGGVALVPRIVDVGVMVAGRPAAEEVAVELQGKYACVVHHLLARRIGHEVPGVGPAAVRADGHGAVRRGSGGGADADGLGGGEAVADGQLGAAVQANAVIRPARLGGVIGDGGVARQGNGAAVAVDAARAGLGLVVDDGATGDGAGGAFIDADGAAIIQRGVVIEDGAAVKVEVGLVCSIPVVADVHPAAAADLVVADGAAVHMEDALYPHRTVAADIGDGGDARDDAAVEVEGTAALHIHPGAHRGLGLGAGDEAALDGDGAVGDGACELVGAVGAVTVADVQLAAVLHHKGAVVAAGVGQLVAVEAEVQGHAGGDSSHPGDLNVRGEEAVFTGGNGGAQHGVGGGDAVARVRRLAQGGEFLVPKVCGAQAVGVIGLPAGVEGVVGVLGHKGAGVPEISAAGVVIPGPEHLPLRVGGHGQNAVGLAEGDGLAGGIHAAAVGVEGDGVGVGRPVGVEGVLVGGGDLSGGGHLGPAYGGGVPAVQGVARAGNSGHAVGAVCPTVGDFSGRVCRDPIVVDLQRHRVLVGRPVGVEGLVGGPLEVGVVYHIRSAGRGGVPAVKGISRPGGGGQGTVFLAGGDGFAGRIHAAAVGVEGDLVLVGRPFGGIGHIPGGHGVLGHAVAPAGEGIARLGGRGQGPQLIPGVDGAAGHRRAAIGVKGDGVGVPAPPGVEGVGVGVGHLRVRRHPAAPCLAGVPPGEGVARPGGVGEANVFPAVGEVQFAVARGPVVVVQRHGHGLGGPAGVEGVVFPVGDLGEAGHPVAVGLGGVPAAEGIARPGGGGQSAVGLAVGDGLAGLAHAAAVGVKGDGGALHLPEGVKGVVIVVGHLGFGVDDVAALGADAPGRELVARAGGGGQVAVGLAVGDGLGGLAHRAAVGVEGDGGTLGLPLGGQLRASVLGVALPNVEGAVGAVLPALEVVAGPAGGGGRGDEVGVEDHAAHRRAAVGVVGEALEEGGLVRPEGDGALHLVVVAAQRGGGLAGAHIVGHLAGHGLGGGAVVVAEVDAPGEGLAAAVLVVVAQAAQGAGGEVAVVAGVQCGGGGLAVQKLHPVVHAALGVALVPEGDGEVVGDAGVGGHVGRQGEGQIEVVGVFEAVALLGVDGQATVPELHRAAVVGGQLLFALHGLEAVIPVVAVVGVGVVSVQGDDGLSRRQQGGEVILVILRELGSLVLRAEGQPLSIGVPGRR